MRDDYNLNGPTTKIQVDIEQDIADKLAKMEKETKFSQAALVNVALKRFISQHKDFLPRGSGGI